MSSEQQSTESDALDLTAISDKWLQQCGPCDGGLPMGCACPDEDYRPTMAALVDEVERLRADAIPPAETCRHGVPPFACATCPAVAAASAIPPEAGAK